jgi:hypothetical protein
MKSEFDPARYRVVRTGWYYLNENGSEVVDECYDPDLDGYVPVLETGFKIVYVKRPVLWKEGYDVSGLEMENFECNIYGKFKGVKDGKGVWEDPITWKDGRGV